MGYLHEPSIEEWLKEAERVARTAGWDNEMKIRFFGDRLRHMALALHEDLLSKWVKPNFAQWKAAMLERFQDKSAHDTYKRALELLQQKPTQRAMDFGSQIDEVYKKAYGSSAATSADPDVTLIREDMLNRKHALTVPPAAPTVAAVAPSEEKLLAIIEKLDKMKFNDRNKISQGRPNFGTNRQARGVQDGRYQPRPQRTFERTPPKLRN